MVWDGEETAAPSSFSSGHHQYPPESGVSLVNHEQQKRGEGQPFSGEADKIPREAAESCKQAGDAEICLAVLWSVLFPSLPEE